MTIAKLSNLVVVERLKKLAKAERTCLARFLAYLGEAAERRLYASERPRRATAARSQVMRGGSRGSWR
jgi:hypothetical protein